METQPKDLRTLSKSYPRLETLIHHVNYDSLLEEHRRQSYHKAVGIDGIGKSDYEKNLEENLNDLLSRMKSFSYRPKPVRRTYIPKPNGDLRPLGIPAYEDRLVQGVMANILNDIYEPRFLDCSYGFRENRSVHDAIREVNQTIMYKGVNYILDCDIRGFFDNVDHKWLIKFLEHDIADRNFIRYIVRFLKSGYVEDGVRYKSEKGTPQGGLISPVLANVFLHYVLDTWFERKVKPELKGKAYMVRFADDFIMMFQYEKKARQVYEKLLQRLAHFNLEVAADKTRILPFGRFKGTKETFDFLGFTHYNSTTRTGKYTIGRKISKKKKKLFKRNLKIWLKNNRVLGTSAFMIKLNIKITGAYRFYGISGMMKELQKLHTHVYWTTFKWLNRRSQRRSYNADEFTKLWKKYINPLRIYRDIWGWKPISSQA